MENTSDSFMPRPLLFCLKSGRSVCYSVPDNIKDFLLVSMGMGIGVVLMCILSVGKEADYKMKQLKESEDN